MKTPSAKKPSLAAFATQRKLTATTQCKTCLLPKKLKTEVDAALRSGTASPEAISIWLQDVHNLSIGRSAIETHRRKHAQAEE